MKTLILWIGRWRRSGAVSFLKAPPWSPRFVICGITSSDEEDEPRHARGAGKADVGPPAEPAARGGTRKRKQGVVLFGSAPKKTKNPTAATRRKEAAAKAAKF